MGEICASCLDFDMNKIVKSKNSLKPKWLEDKNYVHNFIENNKSFLNKFPKKFNTKMKLFIGKQHSGKKILYWAAAEKNGNHLHINGAKNAYGNFSNSGISLIDKNGDVLLKFSCPQIYHTTPSNKNQLQTYYRHLHFVISNEKKDKWADQIYTKLVVCKFDLDKSMKLLKSGNFVFINALPCEYYGKDHIPNSYNLTHKQVKKMTQNELFLWLENVIKLHYPNINHELKTKKIKIHEVPIITYCAHEKCNASELLLEELMKKGIVNSNEYSGGMKEYRKHFN